MEKFGEHIPEHIKNQMMECIMKYSEIDKLKMIDSWESKGCPKLDIVNKIIW